MSCGEGTRVVIELDSGDGPVRGQLLDGGGSPAPFRGWLELLAALEAARPRPEEARRPEGGNDR